jgi:hypothetical protein
MFAFPSFVFTVMLAIDLLEVMESGYTVTFPGVYGAISLVFLFCLNVPFVFAGSWCGRDNVKMSVPTKTNRVARELPQSNPWFVGYKLNLIFSSIIPTIVIYYALQ